jgi:hypothetical protein
VTCCVHLSDCMASHARRYRSNILNCSLFLFSKTWRSLRIFYISQKYCVLHIQSKYIQKLVVSFGNWVPGNLVHKPYTCVSHMPSIAVSFMWKKIIFCALQSKSKFSYSHLQIVGDKKNSCLKHQLSAALTHLKQRTDGIVDINIKIKHIVVYFIYQSGRVTNNFLNFVLHTIFLV